MAKTSLKDSIAIRAGGAAALLIFSLLLALLAADSLLELKAKRNEVTAALTEYSEALEPLVYDASALELGTETRRSIRFALRAAGARDFIDAAAIARVDGQWFMNPDERPVLEEGDFEHITQAATSGLSKRYRRADGLERHFIPLLSATPGLARFVMVADVDHGTAAQGVVGNALQEAALYFVAAVLLCVILAIYLRRHVRIPLARVTSLAERLGRGEFSARTGLKTSNASGNEVQRLAHAIDRMAAKLEANDASLRAQADRIRLLMDNTAEGIAGLDSEGCCIFANRACLRMLGCESEAQLLGLRFNWVRPESTEDSNSGVHVQRRVQRLDGTFFEAEYWLSPLLINGAALGHVVTLMDVSERETARQALETSEARYRAVMETLDDVVCRWSPDGRITFANERLCEFAGLPREQVLGAYWPTLTAGNREVNAEQLYREFIQRPEPIRLEQQANGRVIDWSIVPLFDASGALSEVQATGRDITTLKVLERDRLALTEQVQEARKLESLSALAGGIAHDFNNLLMGIQGHADILQAQIPAGSPLLKSVQRIESSAAQAAKLCEQILAYTGQGGTERERIDLSLFLRTLGSSLEAVVPHTIALHQDYAAGLPRISADAGQLRQLANHLVKNACEAIGQNSGVVRLHVYSALYSAEVIGASAAPGPIPPAGRYVVLEVTDSGGGISPTIRGRIFEPFFSTRQPGRGLGLAASLGIAHSHGGTIFVDSVQGAGTTVRVIFPVSAVEDSRAESEPDTRHPILVVDDEPSVRTLVGDMLETMGVECVFAENGAEALRLYDESGGGYSAIILDLSMPVMDGRQTLLELVRRGSTAPVILSSGFTLELAQLRDLARQGVSFLHKPFSLEQMRSLLTRLLQQPAVPAVSGVSRHEQPRGPAPVFN